MKSDKYFQQRNNNPPVISSSMANSVSQYRKEVLRQEMEEGHFRESHNVNVNQPNFMGKTSAGNVVSNQGMKKFADTSSGSSTSSGGWRGNGGNLKQSPEVYSPLWLNSNLNLPRDRATVNAWSRAFFALNPIVHNAVSLHSTYPISKLNITCKDQKIKDYFDQMAEEIDLMNICCQIAQEYWILGESFPYAELDERSGKWSKILIQNPDYIVVKHSVVAGEPIISLRPDENLRRIVTSNRPSDMQQRQKLNKSIVEHVRRGENIPLSNLYVSHLANKTSPYETRGTGLIVSSFRQLMLFDQLRECKFAQVANMVNPWTIIKVGGPDYKPTPADLEAWREVFESAHADRDFKIFTHEAVAIERVGANGAILDTSGDITQLIKEIYIGLMVPSVLMDGGGDTTYANGGVALDVLRQRYMQFRNMLAAWLRRKIFAPISKINDFYEYRDGKKVLIVPEVHWNHMSLFDTDSYINTLSTLAQATPPKVSNQSLYHSLGLDWEEEQRKIKEEQIAQAILAKEEQILARLPLNELKSLGPTSEIKEIIDSPLPGEQASEDAPPEGAPPGMPPGAESLPGIPPPPPGPPA